MSETINITPDFAGLYNTFKRETEIQAENLDTPDTIETALQLLVPVNICLQTATTIATIQEMREWLADMVTTLRDRQWRLAEAAEERERRMAELHPGGLL